MSVTGIVHIGLTVSNLQASVQFWSQVMGFSVLYTNQVTDSHFLEHVTGVAGAKLRLAMLAAPSGHRLELIEYETGASEPTIATPSAPGASHVALEVTDLDGVLERMKAYGWCPRGEVQTILGGRRAGLRVVYCFGPDSLTLELMEPPLDRGNIQT
jgi:catechol 2,3-dioxygenase-like lactoylglutathione lyase family enzyme